MMSAKTSLYSLIAFSTLTVCAQTRVAHHPLDALTTDEYWIVHDVLQQSGHLTDKTLFSSVLLHEPDKDKVLAWKPGDPIPRESDVILEDQGKTIEARVNIAGHKLEFWNQVPGVQAPITESELDTMTSENGSILMTNNSFMVDRLVQEPLSGHSRKIIWAGQSSIVAHTEKDAILDLDLRHPSMWHFINQRSTTRAATPPDGRSCPAPRRLASPRRSAQRVGAFSGHQMWVTPYRRTNAMPPALMSPITRGFADCPNGPRRIVPLRTQILSVGTRWASTTLSAWKTGRSCRRSGTIS